MAMEYPWWWPTSSSWISPGAALFLLCNVLVGAIVVTSSRGEKGGGRAAVATRRLCRSASSMVLDRLRSFSMFAVPMEDGYHPSLELEAETHQPQQDAAEPAIPTATASAPVVVAASATLPESAKEVAEVGKTKDEPISSDEVHGTEGHGQQPPSPSPAVATATAEATAVAERPASVVGSIVQRARACRREFVEEALEGKAALNARAELFIQQFREDLKLQRLNSIINYTRALRRGAGGSAPSAGE